MVIGISLILLGLAILYWEYRYQTEGWGRGWMKAVPRHAPKFPTAYPEVFEEEPREIDIDLPSVDET